MFKRMTVAGFVLLSVTGSAMAADVTLRISLQLPLKSHLGQNLVMFEQEVEEKSSGAIDVQKRSACRSGIWFY